MMFPPQTKCYNSIRRSSCTALRTPSPPLSSSGATQARMLLPSFNNNHRVCKFHRKDGCKHSTSSSALAYTVDIKDTEAVTPRKAQEGKNDVVEPVDSANSLVCGSQRGPMFQWSLGTKARPDTTLSYHTGSLQGLRSSSTQFAVLLLRFP